MVVGGLKAGCAVNECIQYRLEHLLQVAAFGHGGAVASVTEGKQDKR